MGILFNHEVLVFLFVKWGCPFQLLNPLYQMRQVHNRHPTDIHLRFAVLKRNIARASCPCTCRRSPPSSFYGASWLRARHRTCFSLPVPPSLACAEKHRNLGGPTFSAGGVIFCNSRFVLTPKREQGQLHSDSFFFFL